MLEFRKYMLYKYMYIYIYIYIYTYIYIYDIYTTSHLSPYILKYHCIRCDKPSDKKHINLQKKSMNIYDESQIPELQHIFVVFSQRQMSNEGNLAFLID